MDDKQYEFPEQLILARQAPLLSALFKLVAGLTVIALLLIVFLPGFATNENVLEPFLRNTVVLIVIAGLYTLLKIEQVLASLYGTIASCAVIAAYTVYQESPGNMQMLALLMFPTCFAGFLPRRSQFWMIYSLNLALLLFMVWVIIQHKGVMIEYRSITTLAMLFTLISLLIDSLSSSYRDSITTTYNQLKEISAAEAMLHKLDADLDLAVSERMKAESVSDKLAIGRQLALEVAGAGEISINPVIKAASLSTDFAGRYGLRPPENLHQLTELIHPSDRKRFELLVNQEAVTRDRFEGDFQIDLERPTYWLFMLQTEGPDEDSGTLQGIVVDVTSRVLEQQRVVAEESKLHESQRLESLGVLAGSIAHDFNNLLHVIMLNADLARKEVSEDSKPATSLDRLMMTVDRASELCSELLAYSGRGTFSIETFDLEQLVAEMQNLLKLSTPKGVEIEFTSDESSPQLSGDITQIRQVIMNLITNAGESTGNEDGLIRLSVATLECDNDYFAEHNFIERVVPGNYAAVVVADNGSGMDADTARRMFDPFFTTKETGHGLGLSAVLGIIRGHDGTIQIESRIGEGTTITMLLPLATKTVAVTESPPEPEQTRLTKGLILFADDEPEIRQLAKVVLEDAGYTIIEAADGKEAVELFRERFLDLHLVILDLMMPNKTGLEAYNEIREIDSSVPVVFSSGFNENDALQQLPPKTKSAFLKKPYLADDLRGFVQSIIEPRY